VQHIQLFFCLLELAFEPGNLFLVGLLALFEFDLEKGEFFHSFLYSLFVFIEHTVGGSVFGLESFVDVFEFDNFFLEIFEFGFEIIPFSFDQLKFLLKDGSLVFFLFLNEMERLL
jgi:hypothetical protein